MTRILCPHGPSPPIPCDSLGDESSSWKVILEIIDSPIDNPREIMPLHASILPNLEKVHIGKQNLESTQAEFSWPSLKVSPLDQVKSWVSSIELSSEFSNSSLPINECPVPPLCLDSHFQGAH